MSAASYGRTLSPWVHLIFSNAHFPCVVDKTPQNTALRQQPRSYGGCETIIRSLED